MASQHQILGWVETDWIAMQKRVNEEVDVIQVVPKYSKNEMLQTGDHNAPNVITQINPNNIVYADDRHVVPLVEVERFFELDRGQLDDPNKNTALNLVATAARAYALSVEIVLINGLEGPGNPMCPPHINPPPAYTIQYGAFHGGLRHPRRHMRVGNDPIIIPVPNDTYNYPQELIEGIMEARTTLIDNGHSGPYKLLLSSRQWNAAHYPTPNLQKPFDYIESLIKSGTNGISSNSRSNQNDIEPIILHNVALHENEAILYCPEDIDVAWSYKADLQIHALGDPTIFRIFGSFALRIKNPTSIVSIRYQPS